MNRQTLPLVTTAEVIKWLKRFPKNARFKYCNGDGNKVCLFSKYVRHRFKMPLAIVGKGGDVYPELGGSNYNTGGRIVGVVPFHDAFWSAVGNGRESLRGTVVGRNKAIEALETLETLDRTYTIYKL